MIKLFRIAMIMMLMTFLSFACADKTAQREVETEVRPEPPPEDTHRQDPETIQMLGDEVFIKSISAESVKEAHRILPAYPGAELDPNKGSISKTDFEERYNLVYYANDSTQKVYEFFRKNVSDEYIRLLSDPDNMDWIEFQYQIEDLNQKGTLFIRRIDDSNTEIVYNLERNLRSG